MKKDIKEYKGYYSNGNLQIHYYYKDDNITEGMFKIYNSNGKLYYHCYYKNDLREGEGIYFK